MHCDSYRIIRVAACAFASAHTTQINFVLSVQYIKPDDHDGENPILHQRAADAEVLRPSLDGAASTTANVMQTTRTQQLQKEMLDMTLTRDL